MPTCTECGDTGWIRWPGMNNEEEIEKCVQCENRKLRAILKEVVEDMVFCVGPSKGTMAKIKEALK
jgi:hypothetical protein